jgi:hypothetical protein
MRLTSRSCVLVSTRLLIIRLNPVNTQTCWTKEGGGRNIAILVFNFKLGRFATQNKVTRPFEQRHLKVKNLARCNRIVL